MDIAGSWVHRTKIETKPLPPFTTFRLKLLVNILIILFVVLFPCCSILCLKMIK